MIPKIIHYCWFGEKEIPEKEQKCIKSWRNVLPDYEIKLWNEKSFNAAISEFCKQAYETKNYAFVSDYVRAYVLNKYGGLYLDTDVELLDGFRGVLDNSKSGFVGFERKSFIGTAVIAAQPEDKIIRKLLDYYNARKFMDDRGQINVIANTSILTDILIDDGLVTGGERQYISNFDIYPREWFYPKKLEDNTFHITDETVAVHRFSNSWLTDRERKRGSSKVWVDICRPVLQNTRKFLVMFLGKNRTEKIEIKLRNMMR